ncbi:MAG: sortase [Clostridia bacterium]|nr:sortase [Clostridia bacterium]
MSRSGRSRLHTACMAAGFVLIAASLMLLAWWQYAIHAAISHNEACVAMLRSLTPNPQPAIAEKRTDNTMAAFSFDGTDYLGVLEMPAHGSALPVAAGWTNPANHPCRYSGSVHDGSLIIGASAQKGQYDFYRQISVGDMLYLTDVTGSRYAYLVSDILYRTHADASTLTSVEAELTLFIKNPYAFEYILVYCDAMG